MDELFSCRNCIHNGGQSLAVGRGIGFCLQHRSVIHQPERTTCKYLHRKDLPHFVVDEGLREHAAEFAGFARLVTLDTKRPIERVLYSERFQWEQGTFDSITHALAQYDKTTPKWVFISAFTGGIDGRRSLVHSSLIRHYMDRCGTWTSSYRLLLEALQELDLQPRFSSGALADSSNPDACEAEDDALWDVVFSRLSAVQEYGWHAGLEPLMWASDALNGGLAELNWSQLQNDFARLREEWIRLVIDHAREHGAFFPALQAQTADAADGDV
ncbi:MAG TPA: hypothetical protein VML55_15390 [Planctomycetaceae bacterium]|nr:hypothetical protein [Planctomycetaceae bacterium]